MAVVLTDDQVAGVARGEGGRMQLDAERERHGVVAGAVDEQHRDAERQQLRGRGGRVALGHLVRRPAEELDRLQTNTEDNLRDYVRWAQAHGFRADYRMAIGTEAVATVEAICRDVAEEFPRAIFFTGRLIFKEEKWYYRLLHNETPNAIQRRLQFDGLQAIVLPIRVLEG